jgi:hypothetical protein
VAAAVLRQRHPKIEEEEVQADYGVADGASWEVTAGGGAVVQEVVHMDVREGILGDGVVEVGAAADPGAVDSRRNIAVVGGAAAEGRCDDTEQEDRRHRVQVLVVVDAAAAADSHPNVAIPAVVVGDAVADRHHPNAAIPAVAAVAVLGNMDDHWAASAVHHDGAVDFDPQPNRPMLLLDYRANQTNGAPQRLAVAERQHHVEDTRDHDAVVADDTAAARCCCRKEDSHSWTWE